MNDETKKVKSDSIFSRPSKEKEEQYIERMQYRDAMYDYRDTTLPNDEGRSRR